MTEENGKTLPDYDGRPRPAANPAAGAAEQTPPPPSSSDAPTQLEHPGATPVSDSPTLADGTSSGNTFLQPGSMLGGRYRILRLLGEGGMGAVYQARDLELERVIALKVIRPELAGNPAILQRFKQELILARHVTHKNVVRIYDLGEADRTKFITMEFVDGEDLRGTLRRKGKLPAAEAVEIVQQICRALEAAHAEGVIHRDLKPQNVMRDGQGRVVVMDFGLARSLEAPGMTQTGALVGTLEYMSPEQAMGRDLDQRSDIFAVGLIFFELLTGKVPYKAETGIASLMKRAQERAVSASEIDSSVPESLSAIVSSCLERDPKDRCSSAKDLRKQLEAWQADPGIAPAKTSSTAPTSSAPQTVAPRSSVSGVSGPRSVQISLEMPSNRTWMWAGGIAAVIIAFLAIPATRHLLFPNREASIQIVQPVQGIPDLSKGKYMAVMPLRVLGDEKSLRYVADGLVDALNTKLFQLQEVHVASSSAVDKVAGKDQPLEKTARELGVNLVLQGTVQGSADRLRITLNLEDVSLARRVWAQEFSGVPQDLLTLEDQIYGGVVTALNLNPTHDELARGGVHPTENTAAYDLYLKGRTALSGSQGTRDTDAAIKFLESALQQDPNFALAYTGLADADLRKYQDGKDPLYAQKALAVAQKAAALNPNLPETHLSLGSVYNATGKSAQAIDELKSALALAPNSDEAYRRLGDVYRAGGRQQEAISAYQSAVAANPYYWFNHNALGGAFYQFGENEKALAEYQKVTEMAPDYANGHANMGGIYFRMGRWTDAIAAFQKSVQLRPNADGYSNLGTAYFFLKRYDESVEAFERAVELEPKDEVYMGNLADAYRWSGQKDKANATYDRAIALAFQQLQVNPKLAGVTGDLAMYYAKKGDAAHAAQYIRQARAIDASDVQLMYNQALIYAITGKQTEAIAALREAFKKGYAAEEAQNDPELEKLKGSPEFVKLMGEFAAKGK